MCNSGMGCTGESGQASAKVFARKSLDRDEG
jgi:hypothetical protein